MLPDLHAAAAQGLQVSLDRRTAGSVDHDVEQLAGHFPCNTDVRHKLDRGRAAKLVLAIVLHTSDAAGQPLPEAIGFRQLGTIRFLNQCDVQVH